MEPKSDCSSGLIADTSAGASTAPFVAIRLSMAVDGFSEASSRWVAVLIELDIVGVATSVLANHNASTTFEVQQKMASSSTFSVRLRDPPKPKFKATRLWNNLVKAFRDSIPTRRRRWRMKSYDNCFSGVEAADFLHEHMQWTGTFGNVTRLQAVRLCQKFLDMKIIADARGKANKIKFSDDGHLYRLCEPLNSPRRSVRRPLSTVVVANTHAKLDKTPGKIKKVLWSGRDSFAPSEEGEDAMVEEKEETILPMIIENCHTDMMEVKELDLGEATTEDVSKLWKELTVARLLHFVDLPTLDGLFESDVVTGKHIASNANRIAQIFMSKPRHLLEDETEAEPCQEINSVLPYWVSSAMTFLKKWPHGDPQECGFTLPIYDGFEKDVLVAVSDYFRSLPQPLIPYSMFNLHMAILGLIQKGKSTSDQALQLASLLLPPLNRAQLLHLFLFMDHLVDDERVSLSKERTNRNLLLTMFGSVILRSCPKPSLEEQDKVRVLVSFMLDYYTRIFTVPKDLEREVKLQIQAMKSKADCKDSDGAATFCQKITKEEYEEQSKTISNEAISQLLDSIVSNSQLSRREKKKKLKEFQKIYPDIYRWHFPDNTTTMASTGKRSSVLLRTTSQ